MGRKKQPPKIVIPKRKAGSKSLSGRIRKQQEKAWDSLADSVVRTVQKFGTNPYLAIYTLEQAAMSLGVDPTAFKGLIGAGIIPAGDKLPCGDMYFLPPHVKALTLARARFIYMDTQGRVCVRREALKQFVERYWPQAVYDERKGKWSSRQTDYSDSDSLLPNYGNF